MGEKEVEVLVISSQKGKGLLFPKVNDLLIFEWYGFHRLKLVI